MGATPTSTEPEHTYRLDIIDLATSQIRRTIRRPRAVTVGTDNSVAISLQPGVYTDGTLIENHGVDGTGTAWVLDVDLPAAVPLLAAGPQRWRLIRVDGGCPPCGQQPTPILWDNPR